LAADEPDGPSAGRAPERRPRPGRGERRRGRGGLGAFLLASAIPAGLIGWFLLQPPERRQELLDKVPSGAGGRAIAAGVAFGTLALLAWVALPAFHASSQGIRASLQGLRARGPAARAVLFPVEALLGLLWFLLQLLFALDAFLIVALALVGLLLAARIVDPSILPGVLPQFAK
jgi:hypothetical protein